MTHPLHVLALGAHPDDAEIGCGGTLILASDAGLRVGVADLTIGEAASTGTPAERETERRRAAEILGLETRPMLGLPDAHVGTDPEHRAVLVRLIRELRPRIVLAPPLDDRHPDHAAAGTLVRDAAFLAALPRLGNGPPHRPAHVFHYLLHHPIRPSFVVDVSSVWSRKWEAVCAYTSQFAPPGAGSEPTPLVRFLEVTDALATVHGAMIGVEQVEAFHCPGPVPPDGLPGSGGKAPWERYRIFH